MRSFILMLLTTFCALGYSQEIIVDSRLSDTSGFYSGLTLIEQKLGKCPDSIINNLVCLKVQYFGFTEDSKADTSTIREGILHVNSSVKDDLKNIFEELFAIKFPINKVVPINKFGFNTDTSAWNDSYSMVENNTSAFNYRFKTLSTEMSPHAFGTAIDINPLYNPYEKYNHDGKFIEPDDAFYNPSRHGTITDGAVVDLFDKRGWVWGGRWNNPVDYQHFDLRVDRGRKHYLMKESSLKYYFSYHENGEGISIYSNTNNRKSEKPELVLLEKDYSKFEYLMDVFNPNVDSVLHYLKDTSFVSRPKRDIKKYRIGVFYERDTVMLAWNRYLAENIIEKLNLKGIKAELVNNQNVQYDLLLGISLGNRDMFFSNSASDDFHTIYIPGAYKNYDLNHQYKRMQFLNYLISEDFNESINLAESIQKQITDKLALLPVSRQLRGPNVLETESIKTDIDGIYCRNLRGFSQSCPSVSISAFNIQTSADYTQWIQPKNSFLKCEKLGDAIIKGLEDYLKVTQNKN